MRPKAPRKAAPVGAISAALTGAVSPERRGGREQWKKKPPVPERLRYRSYSTKTSLGKAQQWGYTPASQCASVQPADACMRCVREPGNYWQTSSGLALHRAPQWDYAMSATLVATGASAGRFGRLNRSSTKFGRLQLLSPGIASSTGPARGKPRPRRTVHFHKTFFEAPGVAILPKSR